MSMVRSAWPLRTTMAIAVLVTGMPCVAHAQAAPAKAVATEGIRLQLEALLPSVRIDDADLLRALDPAAWTACRGLALAWRGSTARDAGALNDGRLEFVAESRCREPYDLRAPVRIGNAGLLTIATDRDGRLLWWKQLPDIRRVQPSLMPSTGDADVDRQNRRLHAEGVRVGFSRLDIEIPGDRRIARVLVFEATRKAGDLSPVVLGNVAVPAP